MEQNQGISSLNPGTCTVCTVCNGTISPYHKLYPPPPDHFITQLFLDDWSSCTIANQYIYTTSPQPATLYQIKYSHIVISSSFQLCAPFKHLHSTITSVLYYQRDIISQHKSVHYQRVHHQQSIISDLFNEAREQHTTNTRWPISNSGSKHFNNSGREVLYFGFDWLDFSGSTCCL